jgi:hypothetical protein
MEDIVRNLLAAIEADDMNTAMSYLSSDFQLSGPLPEPIGAREWLGLHHALNQGMPDFSFNLKEVRADGNQVYTTVQISGTQTNDLDLSAMGMGVIPATGVAVQLPEEHPVATFDGDQIVSIGLEPVEGGGVPGILHQLGVAPPM